MPHQTPFGVKTVFLVSPFIPHPPARGIELRICRLLKWMKDEGFRVILVLSAEHVDASALKELRSITSAIFWTRPALRTRVGARYPVLRRVLWETVKPLVRRFSGNQLLKATESVPPETQAGSIASALQTHRRLGDDQIKAWFASDRLLELVTRLARRYKPDAVIAEYIFSAPVFHELSPNTLKIIDTIDVFSRKEDQVLAYGIEDPLACSEEEERRYLLHADVIIAIQSREARLLKELAPERDVVLAGMDFDVSSPDVDRSKPNTIVVVASDNPLNVHGLTGFLSECWPEIKATRPEASLHIVGRVGEMCRVEDPAVTYSGWIDDLDQIYQEASVVINPTIAGTGLKIKSVQALAHGKPLVAWTNGVEGLDFTGDPPFCECRSWTEFADAVVLLLGSETDRTLLARRALAYARSEFAADRVYAALRDRLNRASSLDASSRRAEDSAPRLAAFK